MGEEGLVTINNKQLFCLFCGSAEFKKIYVKLNKKWFASLDLEMFSSEGVAYICKNCGYKHEFYRKKSSKYVYYPQPGKIYL